MEKNSKSKPESIEILIKMLSLPLRKCTSENGIVFLGSAHNALGVSYREPGTLDYFPPTIHPIPTEISDLLPLERTLNFLYRIYGKKYTGKASNFTTSVYLWYDGTQKICGSASLYIEPSKNLMSGIYQSTHLFNFP
ncbi:MAG: hypothetical protein MHPSP_001543, partial [Paramarteilia canceri]